MDRDSQLDALAQRLGVGRVVRPSGTLPQAAEVLDAGGPVGDFEFELDVERLCLDSTSFRNIRSSAKGDPTAMGERILEIVNARGKMHNPETDSGGVALGRVRAVGPAFVGAPAIGARVVTLASLTLTPLALGSIVHVSPDSAQIEVEGTAFVCQSAPWGLLPDDMEMARAIEVYDVYGAASHVARLAPAKGVVYVLGCGHAGKLAMAAAKDSMTESLVVAVDVNATAVEQARQSGLCDIGVVANLQNPIEALTAVTAAGAPPADLTVVVVNAPNCEAFSILATRVGGTVLFFSMATNFSRAALTADGMGHDVTMLIGSGYTPDTGRYALDLARRIPALQGTRSNGAPL